MAFPSISALANNLLSYIGGQPSDLLNQGSRENGAVFRVGDVIIRNHSPSERGGQAMQAMDELETTAVPNTLVQHTEEDQLQKVPTQCSTVSVFSREYSDWRDICARRAATILPCVKLSVTPGAILRRQYDNVDDLMCWPEFAAAERSVEEFLSLLPLRDDHTMDAAHFTRGRVGGNLFIRESFVREHCTLGWCCSQKIAATHTGSMLFLSTLDTRSPLVSKFHAWLRLLVIKYHFVVWFIPGNDEDGCLGHMEIYYTATTLAVMYETFCTVRVLMAAVETSIADDSSLLDTIVVAAGEDANRHVITYDWVDPAGLSSKQMQERGGVNLDLKYKPNTMWQEVMAETLDQSTVYESPVVAPRSRYLMWYQSPAGSPKSQPLHKVNIPLDAKYVDIQVCVQMHNAICGHVAETRVGDDVPNQFDARHPLCDTTPCGEPQRLPVDLHTYCVDDGNVPVLYEVQPSAVINVEYQFHANAFVTFSYNVIASVAGGYRTMQIFDIRFHSEETVLALNMSEMFIDQEKRADNPEDFVETTRTRAVFFGNIGRID